MDEKGKVIRNSKIDNDIQKIGTFFDQIKNNKKKNDDDDDDDDDTTTIIKR